MAWMIVKSLISDILVTLVSETGKRNASTRGGFLALSPCRMHGDHKLVPFDRFYRPTGRDAASLMIWALHPAQRQSGNDS